MSYVETLHQGPFGEVPVDAGLREGVLYTLPGHPDLIIRPSFRPHELPTDYPRGGRHAELLRFGAMLNTLRDEHSLPSPNAYHVVGPSIYDPALVTDYLVTHRVQGVDVLDNLEKVPEEVAYGALANIVNYYAGVVLRGGWVVADLDLAQCMYGYVTQPEQHAVRLVDLDNLLFEYHLDPADNEGIAAHLREDFRALEVNTTKLEAAYGKSYTALRWRIGRLIGVLRERHPGVE